MSEIYCKKCGTPAQPKDLFCRKCGSSLGTKTVVTESYRSANPKQDQNSPSTPSDESKSNHPAIQVLPQGTGKVDAGIQVLYQVTCPKCSEKNTGSWMECGKCHASLAGLPRIKSPNTSPKVAEPLTYEYEIRGSLRGLRIPLSHCSNCYSVLPTLTVQEITDLYASVKSKPQDVTKSTTPSTFQSASESLYIGDIRHTTTYTFQFPLCKKCYYDYRILENYLPELYDPTYKFYRVPLTIAYILMLVCFLLIVYSAIRSQFGAQEMTAFAGIIVGAFMIYFSTSYDQKLKKDLIDDVKMRFMMIEPTFSGPFTKLKFRNQQYRDLVAAHNRDLSAR
jgi:hypothetical protein